MNSKDSQSQHALIEGTILQGTYRIDKVLGEGGFGITYEGTIIQDEKKVAIKEYYPVNYAMREHADSNRNLHIFRGNEEKFQKGLARFIKEAQVLRDYQYVDGVVSVWDFFETNNTAYIVMEYIEGITLKQYVEYNGVLSFQEAINLFSPIIKAMGQLHKSGLIHRDISPDNLLFGLDNKARLIDFGAADYMGEEKTHTQTVILKNGYAPPEQYLKNGKLGSWTDVYALAATMFMALTGRTPTDAVARLQGTELPLELLDLIDCEEWQKKALLKGLNLKVADRYKTMAEFYGAVTVEPLTEDLPTATVEPFEGDKSINSLSFHYKRWIGFAIAIFFVVIFIAVFGKSIFFDKTKPDTAATINERETVASSDATTELTTTEVTTTEQVSEEFATTEATNTNENKQATNVPATTPTPENNTTEEKRENTVKSTKKTVKNKNSANPEKQTESKASKKKQSVKIVADDEDYDSFQLGD